MLFTLNNTMINDLSQSIFTIVEVVLLYIKQIYGNKHNK